MHTIAVSALLLSTAVAQDPRPPAPAEAPKQPEQALIDGFIKAMPMNPIELRSATLRHKVAPKALPALRAILDHLREHPDSTLAERGLEFTIYALVLGDEATDGSLRGRPSDPTARLLLQGAAVIAASDGKQRATAIDAVASSLGKRDERAEPASLPSPRARACVTTCLLIAADLDEREARLLATRTADDKLARRFAEAAEHAARDPRKLLDKRFELRGKLDSGGAFTTADLRGKVVLVDFWATWCGPCVRSLPQLVACREKYGAKGLAIVGVSCDREAKALGDFLAAHPEVDWPQLFDPPADGGFHPLATANGVQSIPRLFLIDRNGILRSIDAHAELDQLVARYIAE